MFNSREICGRNDADSAIMGKYLEENPIIRNDYNKLKQENECYQQELYILRLKLETKTALVKELQEANESLEQSLAQCTMKAEKELAEKEDNAIVRYRAVKEEYENHIANLETEVIQNAQEMTQLREDLRKCKNLLNERLHNFTTCTEDNHPISYMEEVEKLITLLQDKEKERERLEEKCASMENQCQQLEDILKITKEQLAEKDVVLENTREELAVIRIELESLKMIPASDTSKGNSLFAEVEDRRQMLVDRMKVLQNKYNDAKRALRTKTNEIKILGSEKAAMVRKWEIDAIDTLQENADLLDNYKSKIVELENKLKIEMRRNSQMKEAQFTGDSFNYAQSLLTIKNKELEQLNEKFEKQSMEILAREEAHNDISRQFRYWRSKAMSMEVQILAMTNQLETKEQTKDNDKTLLEARIENCTIIDNANFEKTCDSKVTSEILNNMCQQKCREKMSGKLIILDECINNRQEEEKIDGKVLRFVTDTKDTENKIFKKQSKQHDYPIISISDL